MLLSNDIPPSEGIASHVTGLAKRLKARGHTITLMTRGNWKGKCEFTYDSFKVVKPAFFPFYPFHVYLHGIFVRKAINDLKPQPDIIHLHSPLVPPLPKKWPIVATFHSPMLVGPVHMESLGLKTLLKKIMGKTTSYKIEQSLLKSSDFIITVSKGVMDEIRELYGYSGDNINSISNVIDTGLFQPSEPLSNGKLLYVGRLSYGKGLFELIKSASHVIQKYGDVKYTIVGDGPLRKDLETLVDKTGLRSSFTFCGIINDPLKVVELYQEARAVLIPSYYESGPLTLLEAMSCGKAVITTETGLAKEFVRDGINALLIKPKSAGELAEATIRLLSSEELCRKLGEEARKTIVKKINPNGNTDKIEEVYMFAIENFKRMNPYNLQS